MVEGFPRLSWKDFPGMVEGFPLSKARQPGLKRVKCLCDRNFTNLPRIKLPYSVGMVEEIPPGLSVHGMDGGLISPSAPAK